MDLREKLRGYVEKFNALDEETCVQAIPNSRAYEWLAENIPLLECPDAALEETYYFRWWTYRKHLKDTPDGHIVTEFLPSVPWAGPHNSINCACSHHVREGRWLRDEAGWLKEYIRFWLAEKGSSYAYAMWLGTAVEDYCRLRGDWDFAEECLDGLIRLYEGREARSLEACGLYWASDNRDGMEYSIGGSGLRPTISCYQYGDATAISRIAARVGKTDVAQAYAQKAAVLREAVDRLLWDGDFYRTLPCEKGEGAFSVRPEVEAAHRVRELVGYIPWYFGLPRPGKEAVFGQLTDPNGFFAPWGLTTAEQRHPRFMFRHEHECLWNGPVWPFATSQVLTAAARVLREYPATDAFTKQDYWVLLRQYALSHRLRGEDGRFVPWIDEDMNPYTGDWIARSELMRDGWQERRGGYERGRNYNHSTFCDLVLSGLLGIDADEDGLVCRPLVPDSWRAFRVEGVCHAGQRWTIEYRNGTALVGSAGRQCRQPVAAAE